MNFQFMEEDHHAIQIAIDIALKSIIRADILAEERTGLANAIYALSRLPTYTDSIECEFGISFERGKKGDDIQENVYVEIIVFPDLFEIQTGESSNYMSGGWDHISGPKWSIERGGPCERDCDLDELKSTIDFILEHDVEVTVYDKTIKSPLVGP